MKKDDTKSITIDQPWSRWVSNAQTIVYQPGTYKLDAQGYQDAIRDGLIKEEKANGDTGAKASDTIALEG